MADKEAKIVLSVDGAEQSVSAIDRVKGALQGVGGVAGLAGSAVQSVASSLGQLGQDAIRVVTAVNNLNLAGKVDEVRALDLAVQRMSTAGAGDVGQLQAQFTALGKATNQSELAVQALGLSLGKATYDMQSAIAAQKGLGEQGILTGRAPQEMQALGAALHNVLGVTGDTTEAIGKLNAQAQLLGTIGGPAAFADTFTALAPTLAQSVSQLDGAREKAHAFVSAITAGMRPERAASGGAGVLSALQGNYFDLNYTLGYDILDENGQVRDPAKVIRDLDANAKKRGLSGYQRRQAYRSMFGVEMGSRLFGAMERGELSEEALEEITGVSPSGAAGEATKAYQASGEGTAEAQRQERDRNQRNAARAVKDLQDKQTGLFADSPVLGHVVGMGEGAAALALFRALPNLTKGAAGLLGLGGTAAAAGGSAGAAGAAGATMTANEVLGAYGMTALGGSAATGAALGGGAVLGGALAAGAVLADVGQDRDEMGREWLASNSGFVEPGDVQRIRDAVAKGGGDPMRSYKAMTPDLVARINASPELQREAQNIINGGPGGITGIDPKEAGRVAGEETNKALRGGGPLPVFIVGAQAPVGAPVRSN